MAWSFGGVLPVESAVEVIQLIWEGGVIVCRCWFLFILGDLLEALPHSMAVGCWELFFKLISVLCFCSSDSLLSFIFSCFVLVFITVLESIIFCNEFVFDVLWEPGFVICIDCDSLWGNAGVCTETYIGGNCVCILILVGTGLAEHGPVSTINTSLKR